LGFEFRRQAAGSHEIWANPATGKFTTIPNHPGDMPEGTLRSERQKLIRVDPRLPQDRERRKNGA
ncbi:MAG: type II toxin-antitoxin system HicA family toxin, partial [Proteobacteria bacterium]|nr:type II toxin-antitoxin system HicA family toxin [Pseudomonadota bacterium]